MVRRTVKRRIVRRIVKKRRVAKRRVIKRRVSKAIGILKEGKTYRLAFGTKAKPRRGIKRFRTRKAAMAFARKKGMIV